MVKNLGFSKLVPVFLMFVQPLSVEAAAQSEGDAGEWRSYGSDLASTKYSPLDQINRENFSLLRTAWTWETPDVAIVERHADNPRIRASGLKATPLMVGGVLYMSTGLGQIAAIDAATGQTRWLHDPQSYLAGAPANIIGFQSRGVAYWSDGTDERILFGTTDGYLVAVDAKTGVPVREFGENGKVDLTTAIARADRHNPPRLHADESQYISVDSPPLVARDVVVVGSSMSDRPNVKEWPAGHVQAFDVRTGARKWVFHTVPQEGEFGTETWLNDSWRYSGNSNVWSMMSADEELGLVYLPLSTPTSDYYGGHRLGDNLFAESLVAVDLETGERAWHFQTVRHGLWDYDMPPAPNLVDITVDGRRIRAVAQASKNAFTYVFDRATGEPVWPIEDRPVPPSDIPGEVAAATQPFPTKPAAFDRQGITIDDLIDFTPELRAEAIEIVKNYRIGPIYTPPSLFVEGGTRGTIQLPGAGGGANWEGAAVDPVTGIMYVPSRTSPSMTVLTEGDPALTNLRYIRSGTLGPDSYHPSRPAGPSGPQGLPLIKPPYSRLTAIDLNTGEHRWMVPTGEGAPHIRNHPALAGLDLPPLGGQADGAPLLTSTLLIHSLSLPEGAVLVAYDKENGAELGRVPLPGDPLGAPMTYLVDGKQHVAVAVATDPPQLVALTLP